MSEDPELASEPADEPQDVLPCWAVLELMGRRRLAGWLSEQQVAGASFLRIDVPGTSADHPGASQLYAPAAVYAITPTTEETARRIAAWSWPAPVQPWELRVPALPRPDDDDFEGPA